MNVLNTTVVAIAAMLGVVVLLALPLIFALKGWDAWRALPREVYNRHRQQVFHLRPIHLWIASATLTQISRLFQWLRWPTLQDIADGASLALLATGLVCQLAWALRILQSGLDLDACLRRFARYALWGSAAGLLLVAVSIVFYVQRMI